MTAEQELEQIAKGYEIRSVHDHVAYGNHFPPEVIRALMTWHARHQPPTLTQVTREQVERILEFYGICTCGKHDYVNLKGLYYSQVKNWELRDALLTLLNEESVWCQHVKWKPNIKRWVLLPSMTSIHHDCPVCPHCAAPRPATGGRDA